MKLTDNQKEELKAKYNTIPAKDLAPQFGLSQNQLKYFASQHGLRAKRKGFKKVEAGFNKRNVYISGIYSKDVLFFLRTFEKIRDQFYKKETITIN